MVNIILNHWATYLYLGWFLVLFYVNLLIWAGVFERGRSRPTWYAVRYPRARPTMSARRPAALSRHA